MAGFPIFVAAGSKQEVADMLDEAMDYIYQLGLDDCVEEVIDDTEIASNLDELSPPKTPKKSDLN